MSVLNQLMLLLSGSGAHVTAAADAAGMQEPTLYQLLLTAAALLLLFNVRRPRSSPWPSIKVEPPPLP